MSDLIVISSDNESEFQFNDEVQTVEREPVYMCVEEVFYISSSEDDQVLFIPKMKSDSEDQLPKICFETREARRHRHRNKNRKRSNENKHLTDDKECGQEKLAGLINIEDTLYLPNDEPPRIPPLPDLSLFSMDSKTQASERSSSKTKKTLSARKKRHSIEAIRSKEREILGDLFAVERESSDSDCVVTGTRNKFGDFVNNIREKHSKDPKRKLPMKDNSQLEKKAKNEKYQTLKNTVKRDLNAADKILESEKIENRQEGIRSRNSSAKSQEGARSRNSSGKSQDGDNYSKKKDHKNSPTSNANDAGQCNLIKELCVQVHESKHEKEVESGQENRPHIPMVNFDRKVTDKSDTCHQIGSRVGPFDILASLSQSYKKELENLKISPRTREAVKKDMIPVVHVDMRASRSLQLLRQNSTSVESSESESENEKSKRHFMDVFSDISEAETDDGTEKTDILNDLDRGLGDKTLALDEGLIYRVNDIVNGDDTLTFNQSCDDVENGVNEENDDLLFKLDPYQKTVCLQGEEPLLLRKTSTVTNFDECNVSAFKRLNYRVKVEEFSDISEDDESQKQVEDVMTVYGVVNADTLISSPVGGNDYSCNSTLSGPQTDESIISISSLTGPQTDESVISISSDNVEEMPLLEKASPDKSKALIQTFEMPILEKYGEVYSSLVNNLEDQEILMLPDISDDENEVKENERPYSLSLDIKEPIPKLIVEKSSQCSEITKNCDNIFSKFSLAAAKSSLKSSHKSELSLVPVSSGVSKPTSVAISFRSCKSDIALSGSKECSTPKSRKRKVIRKSNTCISFRNSEMYSSSGPSATSSHFEQLSLTKQMDQLTIYMRDFLRLNDNTTVFPKIPETQKNIVYGCEEDGLLNLGHALNFVEHFCKKYVIPNDLCNDIIKAAFNNECKLSYIHWAYNLLSELNTRRSAEIEMNWETIDHCLNVALSASKGKPYYELLQSTLLLQLGVDVLKMDLYTRELSDNRQIRKTYAYKMFAYDVSTSNRKELMYYMNQALHAGQCRTGTNGETFQLPDVLPMLQDLFALCVDVSSSCVDCANMLAADMVNTYKFLPNLADKHLLIKSVSSHLLQCKLVQQVLESQYDCNQTLGGAFPDCLEDIIQCFFKVMPLKNPLTPPTTPNEDLLLEEEGHFNRFAAEVTEEIAILLYFVVVSYLQASNDKLYMALRLRVNLPERKKRLRTEDVEELGKMKEHVQELEEHLRGMTPDLTENTEHYLFLMSCLGDLGQVQQE